MGRELHGSTVGILGLAPTAHTLAGMLSGLGVRLIGYDPAVTTRRRSGSACSIQPVSLHGTDEPGRRACRCRCFTPSRFRGFVNDKLLAHCKRDQLWVGISRSANCLIEAALARGADATAASRPASWTAPKPASLGDTSPLQGPARTCSSRRAWVRTRARRACVRAGMWRIACTRPCRYEHSGMDQVPSRGPMDLDAGRGVSLPVVRT